MRDKFGWGWSFGWADGDDSAPTPPPFGPNDSVFDRTVESGPAVGLTDAPAILAVRVVFQVDGRVNGLWIWKAANDLTVTRPIAAWPEISTIPIAEADSVAEPVGVSQWIYIPFDSPLDVIATDDIIFGTIWADALGHWTLNNAWWIIPTTPSLLGGFQVLGNDGIRRNGRYKQPLSAPGFFEYPPDTSSNSANYWVDIDFQAAL